MKHPFFRWALPDWLDKIWSHADHSYSTVEERMNFVIELSSLNIRYKTGGPFAAAIFRMDNGSLLAPGVNLVVSGRCSVLHAEIVALMAAQQRAGTYDLSSAELPPYETGSKYRALCHVPGRYCMVWGRQTGMRRTRSRRRRDGI